MVCAHIHTTMFWKPWDHNFIMTLEIAKLMKVPPLYLNSRNFVAVFADIENTAIRICYANKFYSFVLKP